MGIIKKTTKMRKVDEIYECVEKAVTEEIELPENWMSSRTEDCVDARYIFVNLLSTNGLSRNQIESKTGLSKTTVRQYINTYNERVRSRKIMSIWRAEIGRKIGHNTLQSQYQK